MPFFNPLNAISIAGIPVNASGKADGKALEYSASQNAIVFGTVSGGASLPLTGGTLSGPLTFSTNSQPMLNFATGSAVYDSTQRDGSTVIALVSANRTVGGLNLDNTGKVFTGFNTLDDGNGNASFTGGLTSAGYNFGFTGTVNQGMTCPSNVLTFASSNGASFAGVTGGISLGSNVLTSTAAIVSPTTNTIKGAEFNGNGSVLTSGLIASVQLPFNAIIESWRLIAMDGTASGSIHIGLSFQNFSGFNPTTTGTDLIGTGTAPNLNNQTTNTGTSSSFNGNIAPYVNSGTYLQFNVISCTGYKWVRIELTLTPR